MDTTKLKKFAQFARRSLMDQVSIKLNVVLSEDSAASRENPGAVKKLQQLVNQVGNEQVIEQVAYTWFNRFCALRFMDVNRYTRIGIVSPANEQFLPEILAEAKMGHIEEETVTDEARRQIFDFLNEKIPSREPQREAYHLLIIEACNHWNKVMPFLFERIDDYTALLIPEDLLSEHSILFYIREVMTSENCQDVEVIGWLYQFYISEKKDQVFDGLKKNKKITPDNIPAATQLFTPHWIVRYLVENSLGRLWMLNRPNSKLIEQMEYYIKPDQPETEFLQICNPEEIKICDPACGSGHMLTYAFDLLYAIYEEEGYDPAEIPEKILTHNLYGIEIDKRAGELAAFALVMKARSGQRHVFRKKIQPNICVLENVKFDESSLKYYIDFVGSDLFTPQLLNTLHQFEEVDNFGSLIRPEANISDETLKILKSKDLSGDAFYEDTHKQVIKVLDQAHYLSPKYHVVIANPPYMGGKGMNSRLSLWINENYPEVKSDLFSAFIVRNTELTLPQGQLGFMSPFVWMFISSYEKLRTFLINHKTITSLVQLEYSGFDGATVPICTFTLENHNLSDYKGGYVRLSDFRGSEIQGPKTLEAIKNPSCGYFFRASASDFKKIPGSPIAYWVNHNFFEIFSKNAEIGRVADARVGLQTSDNTRFLRLWHEINYVGIGFNIQSRNEANNSRLRWFPCNKGGEFRKWYGNHYYVVNWENDGIEIRNFRDNEGKLLSRPQNMDFYFKESVSWSDVTSAANAFRFFPTGFINDATGNSAFGGDASWRLCLIAYCNNKYVNQMTKILNPTMHFSIGYFNKLPYAEKAWSEPIVDITKDLIFHTRKDWDAYETSWDFTTNPCLQPFYRQPTLSVTYQKLRASWLATTLEMQKLEEENNRIFIEAYGLQEELTAEVPLHEITLTCNPHYRYGSKKSQEELETLQLADTMREFISYAVGCMFGRYALEKPGLILANQGEKIEDYLKKVSKPSFPAVKTNVIPMLDTDWFSDDITEYFLKFLKITFGEENYEDNLHFIEKALGKSGKVLKIREYFVNEFYKDHVKRYKKRPIYWLFSSPKGSFNALIYMHRYRPDTVSVVLNEYLREFRAKLSSSKSNLEAVSISRGSSQSQKAKALKELEKVNKVIIEIDEYEREELYPLASKQVKINLDDGVKVNYPKFGAALKKIPGLELVDK